jgi:hypothetical protein
LSGVGTSRRGRTYENDKEGEGSGNIICKWKNETFVTIPGMGGDKGE